MATLSVLVSTLDAGILQVPKLLLSPEVGVDYVISFQYTSPEWLDAIPAMLKERGDVHVFPLPGRGLSRNRNHALEHATGDLLLTADDDCRYTPEHFARIRRAFEAHPEADLICFQTETYEGQPLLTYSPTPCRLHTLPRTFCPHSVEMVLARRAVQSGLRFNTRFGLGAERLYAGEEDVLLLDALAKGLVVRYEPQPIVRTEADTTGLHFLTNHKLQLTKGAVFLHRFGVLGAVWYCTREALFHLVHHRCNPFPLWGRMMCGIAYELRHRHE